MPSSGLFHFHDHPCLHRAEALTQQLDTVSQVGHNFALSFLDKCTTFIRPMSPKIVHEQLTNVSELTLIVSAGKFLAMDRVKLALSGC